MTPTRSHSRLPSPIATLRALRRDPLGFLLEQSHRPEPVVPLRLGSRRVHLLNRAEHVHHVFVGNRHNYGKSPYYRHLRPLLGEGMFTLDGAAWRARRRAAQPAFRGPCLKEAIGPMLQAIDASGSELAAAARDAVPIDLGAFSARLALDISMRCLFSTLLDRVTAERIYRSLGDALGCIERRLWSPVSAPTWMPTRNNRRLARALAVLDGIVHAMIGERRATGPRGGDLLDRLIDAAPAPVGEGAGRHWIRNQVMSILLAAHETTSLAVLWAIVELAAHPDIEAHLVRESRAADLDPGTGFGLLARLRLADSVFREALRLYPPAWCYSRRAIAADQMGSHRIPAGATVVLCPYTIQRKAEYWERPDRFDPGRFHDRDPAAIVPGSYFPFAGGNHICLGNRFAMIEGTLILASLIRDFRFHILNSATIRPLPATTLRPATTVLARVECRAEARRRAA